MNIYILRVVLFSPSYSASCVSCVYACVSEFVFAIEMSVFMLLVVHINYFIDNDIVKFYGISFVLAKVFLLQKRNTFILNEAFLIEAISHCFYYDIPTRQNTDRSCYLASIEKGGCTDYYCICFHCLLINNIE